MLIIRNLQYRYFGQLGISFVLEKPKWINQAVVLPFLSYASGVVATSFGGQS